MPAVLPVVNLYDFNGLALILKHPSGVLYSNQVAGLGCFQREIEGVFIPLPVELNGPELQALHFHFRGGWACLNEHDAEVVDTIFGRYGLTFLRVDRAKLAESFEAWVHVDVVVPSRDRDLDLFHGFSASGGVVTWLNSD